MDTLPEQNVPVPEHLHHNKLPPVAWGPFLLSFAVFIIFWIIVGILITKFLFGNTNTKQAVMVIPSPTPTIILVPTVIPTIDPTADWQTYVNNTYGYFIKFPEGYAVPTQTPRQISQLGKDSVMCVTKGTNGTCSVLLMVYANPQKLSLLDFVRNNMILSSTPWTSTVLNGYTSLVDSNKTQYLVGKDTTIVQIGMTTGQTESQIFSTFRFL